MLREHGAAVIDADRVVHELQQPGQPVYEAIVAAFGEGILTTKGGGINRQALGAIVFSDPAELQRLEQIVHPAVRQRLWEWLDQIAEDANTRRGAVSAPNPQSIPTVTRSPDHQVIKQRVAVIDAIKLLESGWKAKSDAIWVVTCTQEQQLERLMRTRNMSEEEARRRIAAQPPQAEKIAQADVVIDNSGSLQATQHQVDAAWAALPIM